MTPWMRLLAFCLCAMTLGLMAIFPSIALRVSLGSAFRGIGYFISSVTLDGAWYEVIVHEALEGGKPWNAILSDQKSRPYPMPDLAERVMALPGRALPISVEELLLGWRFVLPIALFGAIMIVTRRIDPSSEGDGRGAWLSSLIIAGSTLLLASFFYQPIASLSVLMGERTAPPFTFFDRPVHPQFEAPWLWLFLLSVTLAFDETARKKPWWIAAALIAGLSAWFYLWAWTWCFAVLAVLFVWAALERRRQDIKLLVKTALLAVVIALPRWVMTAYSLSAFSFQEKAEYFERLGGYRGHVFASGILMLLPVFALAAVWLARRELSPRVKRLAIAGAGGTLFAINQQIITGVSFQPDHYLTLIGATISTWIILWSGWSYVRQRSLAIRRGTLLGVSFAALILMGGFQWRVARQGIVNAAELQSFAEVAAWLNTHAPRSVMFANQQTGLLIPAYTSADVWWQFYAMAVPQTQDRIRESAFTFFHILNLSAEDLRRFAERDPLTFSQFFTLTILDSQRREFLQENTEDIVMEYERFRSETTPAEALRRFPVDYVLYDKRRDRWDVAPLDVGDPMVETERFLLYPLRNIP